MDIIYFNKNEAQQKIGKIVEALFHFPSVPSGSSGTVVKAKLLNDNNWIIRVNWNIPRKSSLILSQFGEFSFNFFRKSESVTDYFCKSEYYKLLKEK